MQKLAKRPVTLQKRKFEKQNRSYTKVPGQPKVLVLEGAKQQVIDLFTWEYWKANTQRLLLQVSRSIKSPLHWVVIGGVDVALYFSSIDAVGFVIFAFLWALVVLGLPTTSKGEDG